MAELSSGTLEVVGLILFTSNFPLDNQPLFRDEWTVSEFKAVFNYRLQDCSRILSCGIQLNSLSASRSVKALIIPVLEPLSLVLLRFDDQATS